MFHVLQRKNSACVRFPFGALVINGAEISLNSFPHEGRLFIGENLRRVCKTENGSLDINATLSSGSPGIGNAQVKLSFCPHDGVLLPGTCLYSSLAMLDSRLYVLLTVSLNALNVCMAKSKMLSHLRESRWNRIACCE